MEFSNATGFPAKLELGSTGDVEMLGIIACKVSYALEDGRLVPVNDEQAWPVFDKPFEFEGVTFATDLDFRKSGVDLIVVGNAVAPGRRAVEQMPVVVDCGAIDHRLTVFGDRRWRKSWRRLVPSDPEPFVEMPLTNDRAFGGKVVFDEIEMGHPINAEGRGYYLMKEDAEGQPLPNLEDPGQLIQTWDDHPRPAVLYKPAGWLGDPVTDADPQQIPYRLLEVVFNQTIPALTAPRLEDLGPTIRLTGFSEDGQIVLPTPRRSGPIAHVSVGELRGRFASTLSTLVVLASPRAVIATYLCLFRYLFRPEEQRSVELRWDEDPCVGPVEA